VIDKERVFTPELAALASWVSRYYLCGPGEALSAMIPSGRREIAPGGFPVADDVSCKPPETLSEEQKQVVAEVLGDGKAGKGLHYIYGPTGTGKTEVFLQLAATTLAAGKGVIYLVPEIALTMQVIRAVVGRFGNTVAVLHSALTPSERLREWQRILRDEARVVIGARSAVFAPVQHLGLVIIDEEHDGSYKSGNTPRYHARQVAMKRCADEGIPCVMGSATPSVEAWHLMTTGTIAKHCLTKRLAGGDVPRIRVVDLSQEPPEEGCISEPLGREIEGALREKRQTILFLNRRGYTHFFSCRTCSFEYTCKDCSVPMTFHKKEGRLKCHYCGWTVVPPKSCPQCNSLDVGYFGFGTEFIEEEVRSKFPHARVDRLDMDNVRHKGDLGEKLDAFRRGDTDILLGTQMVAKGLNFPGLKVVGVILADTGLALPDFRARERTFALITQVAGRAGRFFPDGIVVVQSFQPQRSAVRLASAGTPEALTAFYDEELAARKAQHFPPFSRLVRLVFRSTSAEKAKKAAAEATRVLTGMRARGVEILGPTECALEKIAANYRMQVLLRAATVAAMQEMCRHLAQAAGVHIEIDVDPVNLL
jgi:primosomal protein N' (replication factor Y)